MNFYEVFYFHVIFSIINKYHTTIKDTKSWDDPILYDSSEV